MRHTGGESGEGAELIRPCCTSLRGREVGLTHLQTAQHAPNKIGHEQRGEEKGHRHALEMQAVGRAADLADAAGTAQGDAIVIDEEIRRGGQRHDGSEPSQAQ